MSGIDAGVRSLVTLPASVTVAEVVEVIMRDGGVIVADMLSPEVLERFHADLGPYLSKTPFGEEGFSGSSTRRCSALFAKSPVCAELVLQPHFLGAAEAILAEDFTYGLNDDKVTAASTVQVSATQAIQICPGQGAQQLHRDDILHHRRHPGPDSQVQVLYAGTDFTAENGATLVVPGSHLWDDERAPLLSEAVPAVMNKGSGLIYLGSTYHAGGQNVTTNSSRTAIAMALTRGYLRQEENQFLSVPLAMVKRYPARVQQLLGYALCPPFCGWVEMQDPSVVLTADDPALMTSRNLLQ